MDNIGSVTVTAGNYVNCRAVSFMMRVYVEGGSAPIVMNNVWSLAPGVGKIQVEVVDQNDQYLDTADLISGQVAGTDVSNLAGPKNLIPIYSLLLGR